MNIFKKLKGEIEKILINLQGEGIIVGDFDIEAVSVEPPKNPDHGDISTNVAMVLAKSQKRNPRELAQTISQKIDLIEYVDEVSIAGAGFININLKPYIWHKVLSKILKYKTGYGNSDIGNGEEVNIEYVSANPTGPMHIGHARGAVYGDALALLLLKCGYSVTKEYYINDAGSQIDVLAKSAFLRYKQALGIDIGEIPKGLYPGAYLKIAGESLAEKYNKQLLEKDESEWMPIVKQFSVETMMTLIKQDLNSLGIQHDIFTSEKKIQESGKIERGLKILDDKNLLYKGVLEPPKGKKTDDWEEREQTLFKSTEFGDDLDRAVKKADGSYTYFASDIAYHLDKIERGFKKMVIVLGADHGGYLKRLKSIVTSLSDGEADIDPKIAQIVNFVLDGKPMKMSKRAGSFTTVKDVVDEVGSDVVRFIMLTRKNDAVLDFDLDKVKEQTKDNPIFYVQYACARANSVLKIAKQEAPKAYKLYKEYDKDLDLLSQISSKDEISLIKLMAVWPRIVESAGVNNEPHRIAFYLQELAAEFHSLWNKGKDDSMMRFILADNDRLTAARLLMLKSMIYVISSALFTMNIEPVREM